MYWKGGYSTYILKRGYSINILDRGYSTNVLNMGYSTNVLNRGYSTNVLDKGYSMMMIKNLYYNLGHYIPSPCLIQGSTLNIIPKDLTLTHAQLLGSMLIQSTYALLT